METETEREAPPPPSIDKPCLDVKKVFGSQPYPCITNSVRTPPRTPRTRNALGSAMMPAPTTAEARLNTAVGALIVLPFAAVESASLQTMSYEPASDEGDAFE
jgi:hypothetical protein